MVGEFKLVLLAVVVNDSFLVLIGEVVGAVPQVRGTFALGLFFAVKVKCEGGDIIYITACLKEVKHAFL